MEQSGHAKIQVIDRAVSILEAMARYPKAVKLKIICAETGLHPSTVHRILHSLIDNGLVDRNPEGEYRLGQKFSQLSLGMHSEIDLRAVARPHMEALRDKVDETVNLTIREGDVLVYFEKATPNRMMHVNQLIGSRAPLHVTAVGKLMLGLGGEAAIAGYAKRTNLPAYTRNTLSSMEKLKPVCLEAVERGYSFDDEEAEIGVGCIGVPIYDQSGHVCAGLSISAPIERRREEWISTLQQTGQAISSQLGYQA
ncbi:MAG: IclR family transcriptional regulator [Oceanospirillaceae bacterium]|nr:IclR family transcriptional regulator [Oceanospirillaceae bacterium]